MPEPRPLATLQSWMQNVITHPDGIVAGVTSDDAQDLIDVTNESLESVIDRSKSLGSADRLAVYGNAYFARLLECLAEEYSATAHALGTDTFNAFGFGYLQTFPSRSYTLSDLGAEFASYLRQTRPSDLPEPAWPDFLIDLATLERTYADVFDGPGVEGEALLDAVALQAIPESQIPDVVFEPVPCLRLLRLRYPVQEYATAVRKQLEPELPAPQDTYLIVTRRDFVVRRGTVSRAEFLLLDALSQRVPLGVAIETAASDPDVDFDEFAASLPEWFRRWAAAGWFRDASVPHV